MFIFQDANGTNHAIEGAESMRKAMNLPCGARQIVVSDEQGQLVSLGNNADQIARNGQLIKSYRDGEALAKSIDPDDVKIQQASKHHNKIDQVKKIIFRKSASRSTDTVIVTKNSKGTLSKSHKHSPLLKLLDDLQDYKTSAGLI